MIVTLTPNPAIDLSLGVERFDFSERVYVESESEAPAGKGINAARVLTSYGADALAIAAVGGSSGRRFAELLQADGLPAELVPVRGETRRNLALTDRSGATLKLDQPGHPPSESELRKIEEALERCLPEMDWLILSGSAAPGTPPGFFRGLVERARSAGARVLVDTSGPALAEAIEAGPSVAKPNRSEAEWLMGRPIATASDAARAGREIRKRGAARVLLSLGETGAVGSSEEGEFLAMAPLRATGCPVGAGDVMAATCAWALHRGESFQEAARWSVAAASLAASLPGLEFGSRKAAGALRRKVAVQAC